MKTNFKKGETKRIKMAPKKTRFIPYFTQKKMTYMHTKKIIRVVVMQKSALRDSMVQDKAIRVN